tara:strand:+ start:596 stop:1090 length:495 start_codon:yes stop_codon:yes gene_type:complete
MNIFYLHHNPVEAAKLQYNKHVVKMILESAQMLCTAHHHYAETNYPMVEVPYKKAHYNHPSTIWARENHHQYQWLYWHMIALGNEYKKRYNKEHLSITKCKECLSFSPYGIRLGEFIQPPQCMPDEYKDKCSIQAYWNYYIADKSAIANPKKETIYETRPKETY